MIDTFVVPRIAERAATYVTPLKPFEAMAMGLPVVVSDLPALTEIADPPRRGWSFPAGEAESLAHVLSSIADNPEERARMACCSSLTGLPGTLLKPWISARIARHLS